MKTVFVSCFFITLLAVPMLGQNEPVKCIKTKWKGSNTIQIDAYNCHDQPLYLIRVEDDDTIQFHRTVYQDSFAIRSYSIENSSPFDFLYFRNERGQVIYKVNTLNGGNDTIRVSKRELELNDMGDELYLPLYGNMSYSYDDRGNRTSIIATKDNGDTTSSYLLKYDAANRLVVREMRQFGERSIEHFYYNDLDLLEREITVTEEGDTLEIQCHEYDENGFCIRSSGTAFGDEWEMNFEKIECPEK